MGKIVVRTEALMPGSRCDTCRYAHILAGYRESETIVYCNYLWEQAIIVPFKVRECSNYADKNRPTWKQMEDLALPIKETTTAKATGFKVPVLVGAEDDDEDEAVAGTK